MSPAQETKKQVTTRALRRLVSELKPHSKIPSERELSEALGVSRMTLRHAIGDLQGDGLLYSIPGSGTFVREQRIPKRAHLTSFTQDMEQRGLVPSTTVIQAEVVPTPQAVREAWGDVGERVFRIYRLRSGSGQPMCIEEAFIDIAAAPDLLSHDLSQSLYSLLRENYGRGVEKATHSVAAVPLSPALAGLLDDDVGSPALEFTQVGFDSGGRPVEYCISTKKADMFSVFYEVHRKPD
jgi:GntR family transcriptional regulator